MAAPSSCVLARNAPDSPIQRLHLSARVLDPVLHVVEVADRPAAAGPPTSVVVAAADPAAEPCRRVAGGSTDADRAALGCVEVGLDARVAEEPAQRVVGDGGAVDGGASIDVVPVVVEQLGGSVDDRSEEHTSELQSLMRIS